MGVEWFMTLAMATCLARVMLQLEEKKRQGGYAIFICHSFAKGSVPMSIVDATMVWEY